MVTNNNARTISGQLPKPAARRGSKAELQQLVQRAIKLHRAGKLNDAAEIYANVLKQDPKNSGAMHLLGVIAGQFGDFKEAEQLIQAAIKLNPKDAAMYHNLAGNKQVQGQLGMAKALFLQSIKLDPNYAEAYFNYSSVMKFEKNTPEFVEPIERLLNNENLADLDHCYLEFALGKYYDDLKEYEQAFQHYDSGNALRKHVFDRSEYIATLNAQLKYIDNDCYVRQKQYGRASELPVFIVGMPRSGTSLLEQVLSSHTQIFGAGELADIPGIVDAVPGHSAQAHPYPRCVTDIKPKALSGFGDLYIKKLESLGGDAIRVVDKNPGNHMHLGLILTMFPQARIIHCSRDALDTCISCYFQNFRAGQEFAFSFEGLATYYQGYRKYMEHWKKIAPERIFDLQYEDMVTDTETKAREVISFLGLEWEPACLEFHKSKRPVRTASSIQVREPIYSRRIGRWERYGDSFKPLRKLLEQDQLS